MVGVRVRTSITRERPVAATVPAMAVERRLKRVWRPTKVTPLRPPKTLVPVAAAPRRKASAPPRRRRRLRTTLTTRITSIICDIKATTRSSPIYIPLRRLSTTSFRRCVDPPVREDVSATPTPPYSLRTILLVSLYSSSSSSSSFFSLSCLSHIYPTFFLCATKFLPRRTIIQPPCGVGVVVRIVTRIEIKKNG